MKTGVLWCRLGYAIGISVISCWFVAEYSRVSLNTYKALHPDADGTLTVWCMFLNSYSYCLCAIPVLGGIVGSVAIIKQWEFLHCLAVSLTKLLSYVMVLITLIAWVAQSVPRISLKGVLW